MAAAARAQHVHDEIQVGVLGTGQLSMYTHASMPLSLEPSIFPGIPGYAGAEVALASLDADHPTLNLFMLPQTVDIRCIFVGATPGMQIYNGVSPMTPGEEIVLGAPVIHYLPVWNIATGNPGEFFNIGLRFRDASGQFSESSTFVLTFTPAVPAPAPGVLLCAGAWYAARRRR